MDSLSQMVLGAGVGEAILGKKVGNKAILWGAVLATVPDLDVITGLFMDPMSYIFFHRGFSHSLAFFLLSAPLFGWIIHRIHRKQSATWWNWTVFAFWVLFTHALLDCFTSWGTQLFWPLDYRIAWNSIFILDPLYTLPFLITVVWLMFYKKGHPVRRKLNYAGLLISTGYLLFTIVNKQFIHKAFEESLVAQGIEYSRLSTKNTPFNNILWFGTAESDEGYYVGFYSHFDEDKNIEFEYYENGHELVEHLRNDESLSKLIRIMKGYYMVEPAGDSLAIHDLRFGKATDFSGTEGEFVFTYFLKTHTKDGERQISITQKKRDTRDISKGMFYALWKRMLGHKPPFATS